jgi:hypothetical protein
MRADPKPLERPLVVLSGYFDPGIAAAHLRKEFRHLTGDDRVIGVSFLFCGDFETCRQHVIAAVDKAFPNDDPTWTSEVDVVGVSMGRGSWGATPPSRRARARRPPAAGGDGCSRSARPTAGRRWRRCRRSADCKSTCGPTPASCAASPTPRPHADAQGEPTGTSELYPYVRLGDGIVGETNAAPHGRTPWWVPGEPFQTAHGMAAMDARIIADVARRLRGEAPLTSDPPEPLPSDKSAAREPARAHRELSAGGTSFALR